MLARCIREIRFQDSSPLPSHIVKPPISRCGKPLWPIDAILDALAQRQFFPYFTGLLPANAGSGHSEPTSDLSFWSVF